MARDAPKSPLDPRTLNRARGDKVVDERLLGRVVGSRVLPWAEGTVCRQFADRGRYEEVSGGGRNHAGSAGDASRASPIGRSVSAVRGVAATCSGSAADRRDRLHPLQGCRVGAQGPAVWEAAVAAFATQGGVRAEFRNLCPIAKTPRARRAFRATQQAFSVGRAVERAPTRARGLC